MLRSFRVGNHKSIRSDQELVMLPTYDKSRPTMNVAGVFGANASGKSNLLDALRWMQRAVAQSYRSWEPESGIPRQPFKLRGIGDEETSCYVVDLMLDRTRWTYGCEVDDQRVVSEWLYTYPRNRKRIIFEREDGKINFGSTSEASAATGVLLRGVTRSNALFLSVAAQSEFEPVMPVYRWFRSALRFAMDAGRAMWSRYDRRRSPPHPIISWLEEGATGRQSVLELIAVADLGITDALVVTDVDVDDDVYSERAYYLAQARKAEDEDERRRFEERAKGAHESAAGRRALKLVHGDPDRPFNLAEESDGTRAWLYFVANSLRVLQEGETLAIDEIDSSLHPHLTTQLIRMFQDPQINSRDAQLIFTSHDAILLATFEAEDILSRDEIWFVQKDRNSGMTEVYPVSDFHPRKEDSILKRYLGGSYGAIPGVSLAGLRRAFDLDPWEDSGDQTA